MTEIKDRIKELRRVPASQLLEHPRNWRRHPEAQSAAMRGVLAEIGFADAVIARETPDGLMLIDGHLRRDVMGDQEVPVLVVDVTAEEADKMLLTLDPLAAMAEQDDELLGQLLASAQFDDVAIQAMLAALSPPSPPGEPKEDDPGPQMDKAEELREKWGTERGQLWEVGRHRLMCGDVLNGEHHAELLQGQTVDLVLTDPPYGVGVDYGDFEDTKENVRALIDAFMPMIDMWPVILLTSGHRCMWDYPRPTWVLAWVHPAGMGRNPWGFTQFNPVLAFGKDPYLSQGKGSRPDSLVLATDRDGEQLHPTTKPLKVWTWLLERGSTTAGDHILDPFLGSGTTMVAAEQLGRICYGMEIEPKYVAVTLERMAGMGLEPRLVS